MRLLLTHSLLSSWLYAMNARTDEEDPWADFMSTLHREPTPPSEAMQKGIDFENLSVAIAGGAEVPQTPWGFAAAQVAGMIKGGVFQYKAMTPETIDGIDYLLYGRLDVLRAGQIMDIKYTGSYERGKFFGSTQHPFYFEIVPEAQTFTYLISNGTEVWTETYDRAETADIKTTIKQFADWLMSVGLWDEYKQYWRARE